MPILLFLAILLIAGLAFNLAHLDTGGEQVPSVPSSGSSSPNPFGILDSSLASTIVLFAFVGVLVVGAVAILLRQRGPRVKRLLRPASWWDLVGTFIAFLLFASLVYLWPTLAQRAKNALPPTSTNATAGAANETLPTVAGIPFGAFLGIAILASILIVAFFVRMNLSSRRTPPSASTRIRRRAAAEAVGATITELQLGGDVRSAILACYQRFCQLLGTQGVQGQEAMTPRELESLAVRGLSVSAESANDLTSLFEEARYSQHPLGETDRDRAVRSLEQIRAGLEA